MKRILTIITSLLISISAFAAVEYTSGQEIVSIPESIITPVAKAIPDSLSNTFDLNKTVIIVPGAATQTCDF